ncbi:MAG: FAD-binding oxidoreductase [Bacteriovoracaceae bacterium]|nr:FAD-binding oxidoreductase [Bacteriovoracaceae bacterium]
MITRADIFEFLSEKEVKFSKDDYSQYNSDASFLTLGAPLAVVFPKNQDEVQIVVDYAMKHNIVITPRAMGSGTAGASIATPESILMVVDRLGTCNKWGVRQKNAQVRFVSKDLSPTNLDKEDDRELYAVVGASMSSDDLDKFLKKDNYHVAVVPSSGWSSIAGNFCTNAGGNGTPKYGTYKDIIGYLKMVVADKESGASKVIEVTDKNEIEKIGGSQGTLGIITEIGVLVVPILKKEQTSNVVLSYESNDVVTMGEVMGTLIEDTQKNCAFLNAEFLFIDPLLLKSDDPLWQNEELSEFFAVQEGSRKMLILYQGEKSGMSNLEELTKKYKNVKYKSISTAGMVTMLKIRKAATGKSTARVAIPGFEDIYVTKPSKLGIVLEKIFQMCEGKLPGRPIGHQYVDGIVIHYRPQAMVTKDEYLQGWKLTEELTQEIIGNKKYHTIKRKEHGLGLELYKLSDDKRKAELTALKKKFDPLNIFNAHLFSKNPVIKFAGVEFKI